jgi:uncharacterized protein with HEPN domain
MPKRDDNLLLQDIVEAGNKIIRYTNTLSFDRFVTNEMVVDAVLRNFGIIGEAASRVSDSLQQKNPEIEWRQIKAFRNLLIHEYFGVNLSIVWDVIQNFVPDTITSIQSLITE